VHIIETYALSCGVKIDKPYVYEHYSALPAEKYISFNKKIYPYYREVVELLEPELKKHNIRVIEVNAEGNSGETDIAVPKGLSFGQVAYIIKHSLLHFGEDEYFFDLAGYYDIPRVILFSNTYPNTTKPYWGSEEKQRILFTTGPYDKPSLSSDVNGNFVRYLKPEQIAKNVMDLLQIPWQTPYTTILAGPLYRPFHDALEIVPVSGSMEVNGRMSVLAIRMDYNFSEKFLADVLSKTRATVVTDKPINLNLLQALRNNIQEIFYLVDDKSDIQFVSDLAKLNLPYGVHSFQDGEEARALKEKFFDQCYVNQLLIPSFESKKELSDGLKGLSYKSAKRIIVGNKEYKSRYDMLADKPSLPSEISPCPEVPDKEFMKEIDFFFIVKPIQS